MDWLSELDGALMKMEWKEVMDKWDQHTEIGGRWRRAGKKSRAVGRDEPLI